MTLDICGERKRSSPSAQDIREAVMNLNASKDAFLILGPTDVTYIQCSGDQKIGFDLEYQDESSKNHFRAKRNDWDAETIITKLSQYCQGDNAWKQGVEWEKITW
jgi:hypothetical protein